MQSAEDARGYIPPVICPSELYAGKSWEERKQIVREYEKLHQRYLAATQQPAPMNRHAKRAAAAQTKGKRKRKPIPTTFVTHDGRTIPVTVTVDGVTMDAELVKE